MSHGPANVNVTVIRRSFESTLVALGLLLVALVFATTAPGPAFAGDVVFNNVTITDNFATGIGGGLKIKDNTTLRNTVIAHNHAVDAPDCVFEPDDDGIVVTSGGHNFVGIGDVPGGLLQCFDGTGTGDDVGTAAAPLDAELRVLADNGGPTLTHGLGSSSPLRDGGDPTGCDDENGDELAADQRGEPREQGVSCDVGAFEAGPAPELPIVYFTLTPCRVLDSRVLPPSLVHGVERDFPLAGTCGVPSTATVAALNLTAVEATGTGGLSVYPQDTPPPADSTLPFPATRARANNALVGLANFGLSARATLDAAAGDVDLIVDINGYFAPDQPGVAVDDAYSVTYNAPTTALDVLANDTDPEGEALLIVAVSQPLYGSVAITGGGTGINYTPQGFYCSLESGTRKGPPDSFTYEISGGSTASVSVEHTCTGCFTGETLVWTETGPRPIADLMAGDRVWARDDVSGESRLAPVLWVTARPASDLLAITIGDEVLRVTSEHPFWTAAGGWTKAGALTAGDLLTSREGGSFTVRGIESLIGPQTVHNLHVGELHTFFVGAAGILVHNK